MISFLVSAPASGSGKTVVTCALLTALQRRGLAPCAFKCGPDYIDPMFHRSVLGVESHNLDGFLADEDTIRRLFAHGAAGHGAAVCEGAMGLYDGVGGVTEQASAWHMARTLELPVILVMRPGGSSLTLAAVLKGLRDFRTPSRIAGVILNQCAPALCERLAPMLEAETGIPVLGCLPKVPEAGFESRHLGLQTAAELSDLTERIGRAADALEQYVDVDRLLTLCDGGRTVQSTVSAAVRSKVPIAVARDEAFCFAYPETLEALQNAGAELVPFSPLRDETLPKGIGGLYLPGGYPELYAKALGENVSMRTQLRAAVTAGLPTVAECGGFLYLGQSLEGEDGDTYPMAGVLPGVGRKTPRLVRFGYATLTAETDSLLFRAGERVPIHEFHYWDSTDNGAALFQTKPLGGGQWRCGHVSDTLYAAFPHLYMAGFLAMAERFVTRAIQFISTN